MARAVAAAVAARVVAVARTAVATAVARGGGEGGAGGAGGGDGGGGGGTHLIVTSDSAASALSPSPGLVYSNAKDGVPGKVTISLCQMSP